MSIGEERRGEERRGEERQHLQDIADMKEDVALRTLVLNRQKRLVGTPRVFRAVKALFKRYEGAMKALLRLY